MNYNASGKSGLDRHGKEVSPIQNMMWHSFHKERWGSIYLIQKCVKCILILQGTLTDSMDVGMWMKMMVQHNRCGKW